MIAATPANNLCPIERAEELVDAKTVAAIATTLRRIVKRAVLVESERIREVGRSGDIIFIKTPSGKVNVNGLASVGNTRPPKPLGYISTGLQNFGKRMNPHGDPNPCTRE
jgi:hypothetical protein